MITILFVAFFVSGNVYDASDAIKLAAARQVVIDILELLTIKGTIKANILATLLHVECPKPLTAHGKKSGVIDHIQQVAPIRQERTIKVTISKKLFDEFIGKIKTAIPATK